jgi:hypothetical protein
VSVVRGFFLPTSVSWTQDSANPDDEDGDWQEDPEEAFHVCPTFESFA